MTCATLRNLAPPLLQPCAKPSPTVTATPGDGGDTHGDAYTDNPLGVGGVVYLGWRGGSSGLGHKSPIVFHIFSLVNVRLFPSCAREATMASWHC